MNVVSVCLFCLCFSLGCPIISVNGSWISGAVCWSLALGLLTGDWSVLSSRTGYQKETHLWIVSHC